ncbi:MAG: hypothetical protein EA355_00560 [Rhodobacteraceae bacterium]|nr:MAG: hypothetical protein EA355_00560 [Paracoccaceae bacterium]
MQGAVCRGEPREGHHAPPDRDAAHQDGAPRAVGVGDAGRQRFRARQRVVAAAKRRQKAIDVGDARRETPDQPSAAARFDLAQQVGFGEPGRDAGLDRAAADLAGVPVDGRRRVGLPERRRRAAPAAIPSRPQMAEDARGRRLAAQGPFLEVGEPPRRPGFAEQGAREVFYAVASRSSVAVEPRRRAHAGEVGGSADRARPADAEPEGVIAQRLDDDPSRETGGDRQAEGRAGGALLRGGRGCEHRSGEARRLLGRAPRHQPRERHGLRRRHDVLKPVYAAPQRNRQCAAVDHGSTSARAARDSALSARSAAFARASVGSAATSKAS